MAYYDEVIADSPVAYWRCDETSGTTLFDDTANNLDGSLINDFSLAQTSLIPSDVSGKSIYWGTIGRANLSDNALLKPTRITVEAWVQLSTLGSSSNIVDCYDSLKGYQLQLLGGPDRFEFKGYDGTTTKTATTTTTLSAGVTYHVVGTWDGDYIRIYLNAVKEGETSVGTGVDLAYHTAHNPRVGGSGQTYQDEIAIYSTALSGTRISAHYTAAGGATLANVTGQSLTFSVGNVAIPEDVNVAVTGQALTLSVVSSEHIGITRYYPAALTYYDEVLADTPFLYWRLADADKSHGAVVADSSGNGRTGFYRNSGNGVSGPGVLETDTNGGYLSPNDGTSKDDRVYRNVFPYDVLLATGQSTMELWYRGGWPLQTVFASGGINIGLDVTSYTPPSPEVVLLMYSYGNPTGYLEFYSSPVVLADNEPHHIVATNNGAGIGRIYVDGVLVGSGSIHTNMYDAPFDAGHRWSVFQHGTIDEVAVYRTALSLERIQAHYAAGIYTQLAELADGLALSSSFAPSVTARRTISNALAMSDSASYLRAVVPVLTETLALASTLSVSTAFNITLVDNLAFITPLDIPADEAWVVNLNTNAVSLYTDYGFNSFTSCKGVQYGTQGKRIYTIAAASGASGSIGVGKREPFEGFQARAPHAYISADSDDYLYLKVVTRQDEELVYRARVSNAFLHPSRVDLGKRLRASSWEFELYNANGAPTEIESFGVRFEQTKRRI